MNNRTLSKLVDLSFEMIHLPETTNKHFSFLLLRNTPISVGFSKLRSHPLAKKYNYFWEATHSELDVIQKCPFHHSEFSRLVLVNVRVNTHGLIQNSKPCKSCLSLIKRSDFRDVWFTTKEGEFECLIQ